MVCIKCGYKDRKEIRIFEETLCPICTIFVPSTKEKFEKYINDKIDWKDLETFRKYGTMPGLKQKKGMELKVMRGEVVNRAPFGYDSVSHKLIPNKDSATVHSLFKTFLNEDHSLTFLSKKYKISVNGLKKILKNRTYLGELKFSGQTHKSSHKPIISPEIFYAVQRKLETVLRPRTNKKQKLKTTQIIQKKEKHNEGSLYSSVFE